VSNESHHSIAGKGLGIDLEPTEDEWHRLIDIAREFLSVEFSDLGAQAVVDHAQKPGRTGTELEDYLHHLFASGFNPAHPGFMAYIPGGGLLTSALADWIIKSMNRYGTAHFAAPRLAEVELDVIRTFARWIGFDYGAAGVLTTGGSVANFTAVVTARRAKLPEDFLSGVIYCSDQAHHSVMKAANLAGFSSRNLRILPSDENFRLIPAEIEGQVARDIEAGMLPFLVVTSAGTTNTGSIDPLPEIGALCQRHGLWYHIDAAYGGAFLLTERGRERMNGINLADSVTLDPHKGMFLPYGTGSIVVRDRDALIEAHEMRGDYMPALDREKAHLDPFSLSLELSREHRGLKMWLPLMLHGEESFAEALNEKLDLTVHVLERLEQMPEIEVLNQPDLSTIAFRCRDFDDDENKALLETIVAGARVYISGTVLLGAYVLRVSILSHRTHLEHVDQFISDLVRGLREIRDR